MSTFGEIIEPASRATWEDWDDLGSDYNLPELRWQKQWEIPEGIDKLFVLEGKCLWNGMRAKKNAHEVNCIKEANLHLYKTAEANNYICIIRDCDLLLCNDVINLLKDVITKSKMILTVQEKPMSEYQTTETPVSSHIIRKITTTNSSNLMKLLLPKLEQPNIISGISAGVFTLREHLNLSATAVIIYMEHSQDCQIEDLENLLHKLNISEIAQINSSVILNSNLYI